MAKTFIYFVFYKSYTFLDRREWKRDIEVNAWVVTITPPCLAMEFAVCLYQNQFGIIYNSYKTAPLLALGVYMGAAIAAIYGLLDARPGPAQGQLNDSYFNKYPCLRDGTGRLLLVIYMTMPAWVGLFSWFAYKYIF